MGMFDSFIGKGGGEGYTQAQSAGLRRSAEIKKKRKEEERTFERSQEREKGKREQERTLRERSIIEAGQTQRAGMAVEGGIEQGRISNVGQMARQRLTGEQQQRTATTKAFREANIESMKYGRELTKGELGHKRAVELANIGGEDKFSSLLDEAPGDGARGGLEGNRKEHTFAQFTSLPGEQQREYMTRMKSKDPKKYLDFARQYKMLYAPKEERPGMTEATGRSIHQSGSGTYTNY